jgi:hypothetical protein
MMCLRLLSEGKFDHFSMMVLGEAGGGRNATENTYKEGIFWMSPSIAYMSEPTTAG